MSGGSLNATGELIVLGFTFDPTSPLVFVQYAMFNTFACSVVPIPFAGALSAIGSLLFGLWAGMIANVATSTAGAYISLLLARSCLRPRLLCALGRYRYQWEALDATVAAQGYRIALLIRVAPVSPLTLTNFMLALTSISKWTCAYAARQQLHLDWKRNYDRAHRYTWTCFVGLVPSNLPYAYVAEVGLSISQDFPPKDPILLVTTILGIRYLMRIEPLPTPPHPHPPTYTLIHTTTTTTTTIPIPLYQPHPPPSLPNGRAIISPPGLSASVVIVWKAGLVAKRLLGRPGLDDDPVTHANEHGSPSGRDESEEDCDLRSTEKHVGAPGAAATSETKLAPASNTVIRSMEADDGTRARTRLS